MQKGEPLSILPENLVLGELDKEIIISHSKKIVCSIDIYYLKKLLKGIHKGELFIIQSATTSYVHLAFLEDKTRRKKVKCLACRLTDDVKIYDILKARS